MLPQANIKIKDDRELAKQLAPSYGTRQEGDMAGGVGTAEEVSRLQSLKCFDFVVGLNSEPVTCSVRCIPLQPGSQWARGGKGTG